MRTGGEERDPNGCDLKQEKKGEIWRVREKDADKGGAKCRGKAN